MSDMWPAGHELDTLALNACASSRWRSVTAIRTPGYARTLSSEPLKIVLNDLSTWKPLDVLVPLTYLLAFIFCFPPNTVSGWSVLSKRREIRSPLHSSLPRANVKLQRTWILDGSQTKSQNYTLTSPRPLHGYGLPLALCVSAVLHDGLLIVQTWCGS